MLFRVLFLSKSFMPVYFMYWDCIPGVRIFRIIIINVETTIEKKNTYKFNKKCIYNLILRLQYVLEIL